MKTSEHEVIFAIVWFIMEEMYVQQGQNPTVIAAV